LDKKYSKAIKTKMMQKGFKEKKYYFESYDIKIRTKIKKSPGFKCKILKIRFQKNNLKI
jgi:hypothetical protein